MAFCAGIARHDIKYSRWDGRLHMPGTALSIDHQAKSIVLAFRGSLWPHDAITDLDCEASELKMFDHEGFAHSGMLTAAQKAADELAPLVLQVLRSYENTDYRLVLTGHSLGAGVAALVTALWLRPSSPLHLWAARLKCIGYGMPAVASPGFQSVALLRDRITAVVCDADVVPRFSLASSLRLRNAVLTLWTQRSAEAAANVCCKDDSASLLRSLLVMDASDAKDLCPLGRIIWIPPVGSRVTIVDDPFEAFQDLPLVGNVFESHLPQNYAARIGRL
eukprot:TRINITY_DN72418_c0_g1_i1.p1 TRINITY_DN72418_c0_g1~~TRINITY_DN72418_c0_g1_i1.p1  ORF type:complete len:321 (-),score=32.72 TRINITY_DN72418_c0_g1_i1:183-1013(-)